MGALTTAPVAACESRFTSMLMVVVAVAGSTAPTGMLRFPIAPPVFTTPLVAFHPCTFSLVAVIRLPFASRTKSPARVYRVWLAEFRTTKKPSPCMAASKAPPVVWIAPWLKLRTALTGPTPCPTPPLSVPSPSASDIRSWNWTFVAL